MERGSGALHCPLPLSFSEAFDEVVDTSESPYGVTDEEFDDEDPKHSVFWVPTDKQIADHLTNQGQNVMFGSILTP